MFCAVTELSAGLTRGTVWFALSLYTAAEVARVLSLRRGNAGSHGPARALHTAGGIAFLTHVACAFSFYHSWSHTAAYDDTAQQTAALTSWKWGGGLYINYAFALVWLADVLHAWSAPARDWQRPPWITRTLRGFFLFMIYNGAVIFVHGPVRWFGLFLCAVLIACWWPRRVTRRGAM